MVKAPLALESVGKNPVPAALLPYTRPGFVAYLQGAAVPDETPNATTIAAMQELENGGGEVWTGSTKDLFSMLDAEDMDDA